MLRNVNVFWLHADSRTPVARGGGVRGFRVGEGRAGRKIFLSHVQSASLIAWCDSWASSFPRRGDHPAILPERQMSRRTGLADVEYELGVGARDDEVVRRRWKELELGLASGLYEQRVVLTRHGE